MSVIGNLSGGLGNLFVFLVQRKYRFSTKAGVFYGACMTLIPQVICRGIMDTADIYIGICGVRSEHLRVLLAFIMVRATASFIGSFRSLTALLSVGILGRPGMERETFSNYSDSIAS
jgi:hypothetical protein